MDLAQYKMGVDVWQGSLDIDEAVLKASGVDFIFVRMNNSYGQPLPDANFDNQWAQASGFKRGAYYVVSPNYSSATHAAYILAHKPADLKVISLDVELAGGTPATYSLLLNQLITLLKQAGLTVLIYSGGGYRSLVSPWPTDVDYWWAAYPYALYPANTTTLTWDALRAKLAALNWIGEIAPAHVCAWQCSGDRFILPGTANRTMDINLMPLADFNRIWPVETHQVFIPAVFNGYTQFSDAQRLAAIEMYLQPQGFKGPQV